MPNPDIRFYAVEVGSTRTRRTVYYRIFRANGDRLKDCTQAVCNAIREPIQELRMSIAWPADGFDMLADRIARRYTFPVTLEII